MRGEARDRPLDGGKEGRLSHAGEDNTMEELSQPKPGSRNPFSLQPPRRSGEGGENGFLGFFC